MSTILSIYNEYAFYEVVLPAIDNIEHSFVIDSNLFHLQNDFLMNLECIRGEWLYFLREEIEIYNIIDSTSPKKVCKFKNNGIYVLTISINEALTLLVEEKDNPLAVYRKYSLPCNVKIDIGTDNDNVIKYRYPSDPDTKSYVSQHHCSIVYDGTHAVLEDNSSNGTFVNNSRIFMPYTLNYGDSIRVFGLNIVYLGDIIAVNSPECYSTKIKELSVNELKLVAAEANNEGSDKIIFHRAPRSIPKTVSETVVIDSPPNPKELPKLPLFMQIGPAMTMALPMLLGSGVTIFASRMGGRAGNAFMFTGLITVIASAGIGIFWALMNMKYSKKMILEEQKNRYERYGAYLTRKQNEIENSYNSNIASLREKYMSSDEIADYSLKNEKLWNRNFSHKDVLNYRLGLGDVPSLFEIDVQKEKFTMIDDVLADKPKMIKDSFKTMHKVPICIDFMTNNLVGVIAEFVNDRAKIIKNLIVQITGNNSYTDVKFALLYDSNKVSNFAIWDFAKWFPHIWSEDRKNRFLATNKQEASDVLYNIAQIMRVRKDEKNINRPYYILIVLNKELLEGELICKYIGTSSDDIGLSTIIAAEHYGDLPNNCEFIIENNAEFSGIYDTVDESKDKIEVEFDDIDNNKLIRFAKRLSNIEVNEAESGGEIPNSLSFFDMYGVSSPDEFEVEKRWRKAVTSETMKALIGFKSGGAACYLDVHERHHGPHGLVAGTTGSGKSETLQTYILSLALNYSPDDVGFFIIDYKGGGMANLFDNLPHMIGAISNLSGNQVKRAMVSIKSENKRRQRIFSEHGVNNINAYTSLYKSLDAKEPIPHMFIIIDEFAELKREEPEFMRELISVAQVGRSLGVHLILATQKPAGTVDDNIWSNSKFRLCLRVQDRQDSMDMLHRAEAAYITQAGRGYLQVGNDELFELFQSGYSGATYDENLTDRKLIVAQMLNASGKVDLVGNHFKIQYQEEAKQRWIETICQAIAYAISKLGNINIDDISNNGQILNYIYEYMEFNNIDYKQSQYNDIRLRECIKLYVGIEAREISDKAKEIISISINTGARLPEEKTKSQLEAVNEYLAMVAVKEGYTHKLQLWLPILPDKILLNEIDEYIDFELKDRLTKVKDKEWNLNSILGKGDDPANQSQMAISIDFANNGHHVICGTIGTGKSTFLQTTIYSFINKYSSDEVNFYIMDFSSKLLTVFESAKHVGGVMTDAEEDEEKISKFFTMIFTILDERKKILASSNYRDFIEHNDIRLPAIIIVIDNYSGFKEKTIDKYEEQIKQLSKEGISYGVFLLVTAGGFGTTEMPPRLAENFRTTIALEMPDVYQYGDIMRTIRVPIYPESNVRGRGLVYYGEKIIEFQTAFPCDGDGMFEVNKNISSRILEINELDKGNNAQCIPIIPQNPNWEIYIKDDNYYKLNNTPSLLANGYNFETAAYSSIDMTSLLTYAITGTKKSGKSTYMKTLILSSVDKGCDVFIIELGNNEFEQVAKDTGSHYINDAESIFEFAKEKLLKEVSIRSTKKVDCMNKHLDDDEFFVEMSEFKAINIFIANLPEFVKTLYDSASAAYGANEVYTTLMGDKGFHYGIYFFLEIFDADESEVLGYPFMRNVKENRKGIRFGGKYSSQNLFDFANIPFRQQSSSLKTGIGVCPSEDSEARIEQIVVPNYKG